MHVGERGQSQLGLRGGHRGGGERAVVQHPRRRRQEVQVAVVAAGQGRRHGGDGRGQREGLLQGVVMGEGVGGDLHVRHCGHAAPQLVPLLLLQAGQLLLDGRAGVAAAVRGRQGTGVLVVPPLHS